jgi:hypothetical protein
MEISARQKDIRDRLAANTAFAGLAILIEEDPEGTAETDAAYDKAFEDALATQGVAIVVLSPFTARLDQAKRGAVSLRVMLPIALVENKQVNRAAGGAQRPALGLTLSAMKALLPAYEFADRPFGRPEMANGLLAYYLVAETVHVVRADSSSP